ncbi:MAG: hypothetical protein KGL90_15410 [Burkholderiales bacterium]|nr:hypothetical protein [Burkholderiales bacterium]
MSEQYGRVCSLIVGDPTGEALDLSELHIRFAIINGDVQTPKTANIRIYNLSDETARRVQKESTQVVLQAGYAQTVGVIFSGQIRQIKRGRENATDTFVDIIASDGDVAYNFAKVNTTLAAGWTPTDQRNACLESMKPYGITAGQMAPLPDIKAPRALPMYDMARNYLRALAETHGMTWSIVLGQLQMLPIEGTLGGTAIELTSDSGLIGMPQQTIDGIMVKCLINPRIKPGAQIKLNNASIQDALISTSVSFVDKFPTKDTDGNYKVWAVATCGDTRGQDWYMDLVCTGIDGTEPITPAFTQQRGIYGS